jgi:uncharacterized protein YwqG
MKQITCFCSTRRFTIFGLKSVAMGLFDFLKGKKEEKAAPSPDGLLEKVELAPGLTLARAFAQHWPEIQQTRLPAVQITATPTDDLALEQSKFGHYPCMPLDFDYPKDEWGRFMYPLAQLNFKEIPALPGYPESGYLQFYISGFDDVHGIDFKNNQLQKNFRVLYFEEKDVEQYKADFSFLDEVMASDELPVQRPHALHFTPKIEYLGIGDVRYEKGPVNLSGVAAQYPDISDRLEESLDDDLHFNGHKAGGYAFFTQADPRDYNDTTAEYILLLQIDTDDHIMWGDSGVANFFIHPKDLLQKDFSKVMYNWDCY